MVHLECAYEYTVAELVEAEAPTEIFCNIYVLTRAELVEAELGASASTEIFCNIYVLTGARIIYSHTWSNSLISLLRLFI